jgi:O-antigen/teichoic acid export membrane protein
MLFAFSLNLRYTAFRRMRWNGIVFRAILRQSLPFALLFLVMSFYSRIDAVLIDYLRPDGEKEAGIYAGAFRLFDAYSQIALIFTGILLPVFSRQLKWKEDVTPVLFTALSVLLFAAMAMAVTGLWYGDVLADVLYKEYIPETGRVLTVLLWALIPFILSMTFGSLITASGKLRILNRVALASLVLNLALNFILIPRIGAMGAACTAICVHGLSALLLGYTIFRRMNVRSGISFWLRVLAFLAISLGGGYVSRQWIGGYAGICTLAGLLLAAGWITKLLPFKELVTMLLKKTDPA